jgi:hypothetical protein
MAQQYGLGSSRYALTIDLGDNDELDIGETQENHVVYEKLREARRLLMLHHQPRVLAWVHDLTSIKEEVSNAQLSDSMG